jgi:hypothetical protein
MRNLKLKTVCRRDESGSGSVTLQHPAAALGVNAQSDHHLVVTDEITGIPDDVDNALVLIIWRETVNLTWLRPNGSRHTFAWIIPASTSQPISAGAK